MRELIDIAHRLVERRTEGDDEKPLPNLAEDPYAEPFWDGLREERLLLQRCTACGDHQYFPRPWCQYCAAEDLEWVEASGAGTVYSYTVIRRAVTSSAFEEDIPYVVAYVELEEGPRIYTNVVDCPVDAVANDMAVEVVFDHVTDEITLPKFRPMEGD